ncbi:neuropeptide SIFamide receptor [Ceratitis capitata]|uniref:neuropeptide SIFamide receptor n=1 Tax=Ceratitis capitata TaxID=7213 RepID=UPI000618971F|nr:neuropeptide SIFamide receptor [Ceratitis capitata]XP_020714082.1 neuropeptide SIFamide receptor [Ceratitis capitata]XP_020714083.1 neuropeptide SIFamide receptor [Ceratitis capitata]
MEQFVREYAARSILPYLHISGGAVHRYARYALPSDNADIAYSEGSSSVATIVAGNNNMINKSPNTESIAGDSAEGSGSNNDDYYFISAANTQRLLNDSAMTAAGVTTAEFLQQQQQQQLFYNDSGGSNGNASVFVLSSLTVTMKSISNLAASTSTAWSAGLDMDSGEMNMTAAEMCADPEDVLSSVYFKTIVYLLYIPIFIFALLGNGIVCYIVQSTPRMRTVTNYFIANLAVGDILMTVFCIPFSFVSIFILKHWPFGTVLCNLVNYSQAVSVLVSAYTLVAISIDRYLAIMKPLKPRITKR